MVQVPAFAGPVLPRGQGCAAPLQSGENLPSNITHASSTDQTCIGREFPHRAASRAPHLPQGLGTPRPDPRQTLPHSVTPELLPPQDPFGDPASTPRHLGGTQGLAFCLGRAPPAGRSLNLEEVALQISRGSRRGPRCAPPASCARGCPKRCASHPHRSDSSTAPTRSIFRPPCRWGAFARPHCAATASGAATNVPASPLGSCVRILVGAQD
nr:uncharacterized protein LOC105723996 [Aotus nancymaae]